MPGLAGAAVSEACGEFPAAEGREFCWAGLGRRQWNWQAAARTGGKAGGTPAVPGCVRTAILPAMPIRCYVWPQSF